jgi:SAM-dependent methyltransferase
VTNFSLENVYLNKLQTAEVTPLNPTSEEINQVFESIEQDLPFTYDDSMEKLLTFVGNLNDPIHRWFFYKESYSPQIVEKILERYPLPPGYFSILDPFCGAGTTLLTAQFQGICSVGIELNPFAAFLSRVKIGRFSIDPEQLGKALQRVLCDKREVACDLPGLTTFHNNEYFPNQNARKLLALRDSIRRRKTTWAVENALLLALASTLEDVSCLRRDGRALRYVPRTVMSPDEALQKRVAAIVEDLETASNKRVASANVLQGDAREIRTVLLRNRIRRKFGMIIYSPPYPNNFDYSELYKCELWLLGFIQSYEQWRNLRKQTLRSHPSYDFPSTAYLRNTPACREIFRLVEQAARCPDIGGYARKTAPKVIRGYFDDLFLSLQQQVSVLAPGGYIVCVVGNAQHGNLHLPADALIAKIGQSLGLELIEICVAKLRMSRNQQIRKLRESLVVLRKPEHL